MDDGLIFPYPLVCANTEAGDTKTCLLIVSASAVRSMRGRPDLVVGKRWGDAGG